MKIEFELEMQEAALMMDILRKAAFESNNQKVRAVIGKIINEIESDSKMAHFILEAIRHLFTTNNLTKNRIFPQSDMEYGLGIPKPFLVEPRGLTKMANFILMQTVKKFKRLYNLGSILASGYIEFPSINFDYGPIFSTFGYNV